MKKLININALLATALLSAFMVACTSEPVTPIKDIDVDVHLDMYVTIEGLVTQYTPETSANTTAYYIIKGEFGRPIQVNTSAKKPVINRKYKVKGIIKADLMTDQPYLVETEKHMTIPLWIFIAAGGLVLLIAVVVIIFALGNSGGSFRQAPQSNVFGKDETSSSTPQSGGEKEDIRYDDDFKTVQVVTRSYDLTLKDIPGEIEVIDGDDSGKRFKLRGTNPEGIVTIGREEKSGRERATHLRIKESTVSRKQAELIYTNNKKILLKNVSKVNYTQLNGEEIMVGETREVKDGDRLKFGNRFFKYAAK